MRIRLSVDLFDFDSFKLREGLFFISQVGHHPFVASLGVSAKLARHQLGVAEITRCRASRILALFSPSMSASYSASLLDALKSSARACSMTRPSGDWRVMPVPALLDVEDPSTKPF